MKHKSLVIAYSLCTLLLFFLAAFTNTAIAQCLVNSLIITTGTDNNGTPVGQSNSDPHWYCVNKTGVYAGSSPTPPANALVVIPANNWGGGGNWICDNQFHANPGQPTSVASILTFERRFNMCYDDRVTFDLSMRGDGWITDILVDGISTGLVQPAPTWQTGTPIWTPGPFSQFLPFGAHRLQVVVSNPTPHPWPDPIGFFLNGTVSSANNSLVNDQDLQCAGYTCASGLRGTTTDVPGTTNVANGSMLYQNQPNPSDAETTIRYNVATMQKSAFIALYDLNGRKLAMYAAKQGEGAVNISSNTMLPGIYLYSLVVDGQVVETKRMVLSH